jgi:hypothetical protein
VYAGTFALSVCSDSASVPDNRVAISALTFRNETF